MSGDRKDFPPDFLWGSATAAHQVEGGSVNNDWWAWEHSPGSGCVEPSGDAIDQWNRFDADFALLASLGQNAHRISLEWSKIEPEPGEFSRAAIDHYRAVLESLARHGLTAFVTLHHFTLPRWFAQRGGWLAADALNIFGCYVERVACDLGDLIPYACTVNEPQIVALMAYQLGQFPPGHKDPGEWQQANQVLIQAHRIATAALRSGRGRPQIGSCQQLPLVEPDRPDEEADVERAKLVQHFAVDQHLEDLRAGGDLGDWVGLQYYTRLRVNAARGGLTTTPEGVETSMNGWEVYPAGFGQMLRRLAEVGLPIVVTENGIATRDDRQRQRYLCSHLTELKRALDDAVDVRGYLYWSAFDNFEWMHGYGPTFGLIGIDRADNLRRVVRPSAVKFGDLARSGDLSALA